MTRSRPFPAILALCFALHASGLGQAAILCVSPDGHVSIEAKGAPCCGPEADGGAAAVVGTAIAAPASVTGCGECTDIPLAEAARSASVPAESKQVLQAPSAVLACAPVVAGRDAGRGRLEPGGPAPGRGSLLHIRSIILRR